MDSNPYTVTGVRYKAATEPLDYGSSSSTGGTCGSSQQGQGSSSYPEPSNSKAGWKRSASSGADNCPPCELYQRHYRGAEKAAIDAGLKGIVKHPLFSSPQGNPIHDSFCE